MTTLLTADEYLATDERPFTELGTGEMLESPMLPGFCLDIAALFDR